MNLELCSVLNMMLRMMSLRLRVFVFRYGGFNLMGFGFYRGVLLRGMIF